MKLKSIKSFCVLSLLFCLPAITYAWGMQGHRIVGQVAECYLTKKAKKSIAEIMDGVSVAMSSNYADFIKSDSTFNYLSKWHYVNIPGGLPQNDVLAQLNSDTASNAYNKINFLVDALKNKTLAPIEKLLYLKLLIHIVGDIHQPLHVGRFEDLGGNKIKVLWFNDPYNLHQIWDEVLVDFQQLSYTEYAAAINHTSKEQVATWQASPVSTWIYESYLLAADIYGDIKEPNQKLGYQYNYKYKNLMENQMLKAGVRLAGLLNNIFQ